MKKMLPAILITVAGAFFAFWYFQIREDNPQNNQTTTQTTQDAQVNRQQEATENGKYIVIKEWGIKFELPSDYRGNTYYVLVKNPSPVLGVIDKANTETVFFGTTVLDSLGSNNRCKPFVDESNHGSGVGVAISRSTEPPNEVDSNWDYKVGDYWFLIRRGSAGICYKESNGSVESDFTIKMINSAKGLSLL